MFIPIREIYELTEKIKNTYDERNLVALANKLGAIVDFKPLGLRQTSCKGMYTQYVQCKLITINSDMTGDEIDIVLPHEIGHVALKHKADIDPLVDRMLLNRADEMEISANYFSADYKIDDGDVLGLTGDNVNFFSIACILRVYPGLLAYKFSSMQARGYRNIQCPMEIRAQYLNECKRELKAAEDFDPFSD